MAGHAEPGGEAAQLRLHDGGDDHRSVRRPASPARDRSCRLHTRASSQRRAEHALSLRPLQEQERLQPLFSMLVQELLTLAYEKASVDGPLDPPLLLLLDEAANIAPIPNLDAIASTAAGQGIQLVSVFHDMAQVGTVYGRRAATIVNNHRAKLLGIGISDLETLSWVSRVTGAAEVDQRSQSTGEQGRRSVTHGEAYRDLTPANVVREREPGSALLIYHNLPPAKIDLRLWFEDESLSRLQALDEPEETGESRVRANALL